MPGKFYLFTFFLLKSFTAFTQTAPIADFTANNLVFCIGQATTLTNISTGNITSYSWNFGTDAVPATANTAGPHTVYYTSDGTKTITLTVSGPGGNSTKVKTNYIMVGADRVKIMNYNLLNYSDNLADTSDRNPYFRTILGSINPDILVVQEMVSLEGMNGFLSNVLLNSTSIDSMGLFINGFDTDNGLFYNSTKFKFISNTPIETALRDINEFKLVHNYTSDTLRIYSVHLKASTGFETQRGIEVDSLRKVTNALPAGKNLIVCGDFNIYSSTEVAYQKLKQDNPSDDGHFIDPIVMTGNWNQIAYRMHHTQCTRLNALGAGGASGGLDDRFDMILFSSAINQNGEMSYVPGSTIPYGNDGNHYDSSVNVMPNTAVSQDIADALYFASDHLPVIASFDFHLNNCLASDLGVHSILQPIDSLCPEPNVPLSIRLKNFGINSINFTSNNADIILKVTKPNATIQTFTKTINSGNLSAGATLDVLFDSTLDMTASGNYYLDAYTVYIPDINTSNDTLETAVVSVGLFGTATISASGPTTFCTGDSVLLTASSGNTYLWSNGSTLQSILVTSSGNYSVFVIQPNGCQATSAPVTVTVNSFYVSGILFTETMGNSGGQIAISTHENNNGFDNDNFTMSGTGDVRITTVSSGYSGASAGSNIFLTHTSAGRHFIISGINTSGLTNLQLTFGVWKSLTASNGSDFLVQVSTDGISYSSPLSFTPLPTNSAVWYQRTITSGIPSANNIYLKFTQSGTTYQYRVDDISMSYLTNSPAISSSGSTDICPTNSVTLNATNAAAYLWNTGATSQSIIVSAAGDYSCVMTGNNGCSTISNTITVTGNPDKWYRDLDNDGYGNPADSTINCTQPPGYVASNNDCNDSLNTVNPAASEICGNSMDDNCNGTIDENCSSIISLNVKLFIEGFYLGNGKLKAVSNPVSSPAVCDTIILSIALQNSPNSIVDSIVTLLDTSGNATVQINGSGIFGNSYYIVISHRNVLETWSSLPVIFNQPVINYDFTTSASQAYSGNIKNLGDGNFALYSGDLDHNGQINMDDFNLLKNAAQIFQDGYIDNDLTGDHLVESSDFTLIENNLIRILARP